MQLDEKIANKPKKDKPVVSTKSSQPKKYAMVDMVITNTRIGMTKTVTGPVTNQSVIIFATVNKTHTVRSDGSITLGVDERDAEKIEDIAVPFYCHRQQKWCETKPFKIVI